MDRRNEEMEESLEADKLTTSTASNKAKKKLININNDDDTSTESSDTFDSWTLLSDKDKPKAVDSLDDSVNRIEILKASDHGEQEDEEEASEEDDKAHKNHEGAQKQDSLNDDLSDGISIISESESVGRISPHPYLRDHLHDLNLKFSLSDHIDDSILERMRMREEMEIAASVPLTPASAPVPVTVPSSNGDQHLRQRRKSSSSSNTTDEANRALQKASQTVAPLHTNLPPIVRKGLQGIFLIGVGLAILALIGKIVNPTWQHLPKVDSTVKNAELEQKVNDMELQNNLMRAEIDLLNKQVKYLSSLNDPYQQQQQQQHGKYKNYKDSKTFKAWSGNGDTLKPVDISKEDLRKPYKCPDGSFVEIANMCMEQRPKGEPSLIDQLGKVMGDLKEKSELFKTFEEVAEELQGFQDNPFEQIIPNVPQNKPIYEAAEDLNQKLPYNEKYQKNRPKGEDYHSSAPYKQHKQGKYDDDSKEYKKSFGKDYKKDSKESRFRDNSKERGEWKGNKFNNNSKERKYRKDNSKERFNKQFDDDDSHENSKENHSKERNNNSKQKRKYDKNDSDEHYNGEWQTNYMKHRENLRKTNEQKYQDNKNWYIKRGDSRENKRSGEKFYR
ncbi:hypothetical protein DOY81_005066 [Sarcophaga bullata]|nr:hypothetical protein DOY81_005066 [Sarcophaga bullata]